MTIVQTSPNTWKDTDTGVNYVGRVGQTLDSVLQEAAAAATDANSKTYPYVPTVAELSTGDLDLLTRVLTEPGSVVRALGLVTFQEINKLRVLAGQSQYTMAQFIAALKANIR